MNTPEFREIELQIREEKLLCIKWDEKRKRSMEKQRYRAKMERPRINYIPKGLSVDYEEEYSKYLMQEVSFEPRDNDNFTAQLRLLERWHKKSIPQILEKEQTRRENLSKFIYQLANTCFTAMVVVAAVGLVLGVEDAKPYALLLGVGLFSTIFLALFADNI